MWDVWLVERVTLQNAGLPFKGTASNNPPIPSDFYTKRPFELHLSAAIGSLLLLIKTRLCDFNLCNTSDSSSNVYSTSCPI